MPTIGETGWRNRPTIIAEDEGSLVVRTGRETDYWNNTFYGFRHLNGHFRGTAVGGDFSLEASFSADYNALYDQAGAMVFVDDNNWMKCGVEFTDGAMHFSVVVTRDDQSDWSVMPLSIASEAAVTLRITRHAEALRVQLLDGGEWRLVRLCFLRMPEQVEAGPMTCSPTRDGLEVSYSAIRIGEPISRELH